MLPMPPHPAVGDSLCLPPALGPYFPSAMSDARQGASGCRNIDWRHRLLQAGAVDLLEGTPYEEVSQTGEKQRSARSSKTNNKCSARETCANPHCPRAGTQSLNPRFWALRLDAILDDPVAQAIKSKCWNVMENAPKRTKGPTGEGADDEYSYRTLQSSQWPCLCTYAYAGIQRHEIYQHAAPADQPGRRTRAPKAGRSV